MTVSGKERRAAKISVCSNLGLGCKDDCCAYFKSCV